jgi:hypothetical protein
MGGHQPLGRDHHGLSNEEWEAEGDALTRFPPDAPKRTGYLFSRNGLAPTWDSFKTAWYTALERAAIPAFRFHNIRHSAASHMAMRGATLVEIKEGLGDQDISTILRYSHLSPSHLRSAFAKLEGLTPDSGVKVTPALEETAHGLHIEGKIAATAS